MRKSDTNYFIVVNNKSVKTGQGMFAVEHYLIQPFNMQFCVNLIAKDNLWLSSNNYVDPIAGF